MGLDTATLVSRARVARSRFPLSVLMSLGSVLVVVSAAVFGDWWAPHDPDRQSLLHAGEVPTAEHLLGTDGLGRDIFSRVLVGARPALVGPVAVALGATALAVCFGMLAGLKGRRTEAIIMRAADMLFAIPSLLVIMVTVGLFGGGYWLAVLMLIVLAAPGGIRVVRSAALAQRNLPYIEAARTLGVSERKIMFVHVLPNILPNVVATALLDFVGALVALSALSFLGLGSPPGAADWGLMLAENRNLLTRNPLAVVAPAVLLIVAASAVTIIGDWIYARLRVGGGTRD
jgi:peptide/nickel transport system permease protein